MEVESKEEENRSKGRVKEEFHFVVSFTLG